MDKNFKETEGYFNKLSDHHRGIFLVPIMSVIFEKLVKLRISNTLQKNIFKFQNSGMKGKAFVGNLYFIEGVS